MYGSGGGGRGPPPPQRNYVRFPFPANPNTPSSSSSSSTPNYHQQNPNFPRERPGFRPQSITLQRVEAALAEAKNDLVAAGESISSWKLTHRAAISLQADSWTSLGLKFQDIPSLRTLQFIEGKVNAFIHCFVSMRRMTSVHDLGVEICKSEGVEQFEELGLGPLLRHPLVQHYFSVPPDASEVCKITVEDMIVRLSNFLYRAKNREITVEEFLNFLVQKYSVASKENLGVRVQSMGLYIKFIKGARRTESATLKSIKERVIAEEGPESSTHAIPDHLKKLSSLCEDEIGHNDGTDNFDENNKTNAKSSKPCYCSQSKKSKKRHVCSCSSGMVVDDMKWIGVKLAIFNSTNEQNQGARRYEIVQTDPVKAAKVGLGTKELKDFITTWKDACHNHSVAEVLAMMLHAYKTSDKNITKMQRMFLSYPAVGLLNVAVRFIKFVKLDSLFEDFDQDASLSRKSSHAKMADLEPLNKVDLISSGDECIEEVQNSVSYDDIIKQVTHYFEIDHLEPRKIDLPLERQLILRGCEIWLTTQFSVKEFKSLGHGNFFDFLERHASLLPEELCHFLNANFCNKSSLSVSMLERQLFVLLSQTAKNLGENSMTGQCISMLLKKQFPAVSFQLMGNEPDKCFLNLVKSHKDFETVCSVLFSVTLLADCCGENSLPYSEFCTEPSEKITEAVELTGATESVSTKIAVECLLKASMLSDLSSWSHWNLVFAPSLGPLLQWLLTAGYIEGLLCIVTSEGRIIRIDHSATFDDFLEAAIQRSPFKAAVKLLSLICLYGGSKSAPLSLLKCLCQRAIDVIIQNYTDHLEAKTYGILAPRSSCPGQDVPDTARGCTNLLDHLSTMAKNAERSRVYEDLCRMNEAYASVSMFILDCLGHLPSEFRSFSASILVSGFQSFTKDAASIILHECKCTNERLMLHDIGLSLGVVEWIKDYQTFNSTAAADLFVQPGTSSRTSEPFCPEYGMDLKKMTNVTKNVFSTDNKTVTNLEADSNILKGNQKAYDEVNKTLVSNEELSENCDRNLGSVTSTDYDMQDATLLIETIRREEFGLDSELKNTESCLLKKQHARLGRALHCLSQELYSQDSHFLLELVQNADDNNYPENVEPTLAFILQDTGIVVMNNEQGFSAENIRALCDVGNSTKKGSHSGYIGQKGIGFKSVFRVTDAPEIHSNGFHVKFDISEGQIGFVLPTIIPPCDINCLKRQLISDFDQTDDTTWNTCIVLPFKLNLKEGTGTGPIMSMFLDLHPSLLLFLHRLQCIKFKDMIDDKLVIMKKNILGDGIVVVSHGKEKMSWLVVSQTLEAGIIRSDVQTTKISLAFTLQETDSGEYKPHLDQQPVFAFLPLRKYGMKFILQGDFVLPSSREEVDGNSSWNQWLLSKFPDLFVCAEKSFCSLPCFQKNTAKGVTAYMSFVPIMGEVHGFFSHLPRMIISKLRLSNCLLLDGLNLEWVPPCRVLRNWDDQARDFLSESLLQQLLGLGFLNKDIILPDSLAKSLGVPEYGPKILIEILSSVCRINDSIKSLGLDWLSSWLNAFYTSLSVRSSGYQFSTNVRIESDLINILREIPFIPLSNGSYCSVAKGPVWLPSDASNFISESESGVKHLCGLYAKLRIVTPLLFSAVIGSVCSMEDNRVDNIVKLLHKIGVQNLSAHDIVRNHILPSISDGKFTNTDTNLMTDYLCFIMIHLQSVCSNCHVEREDIFSELRKKSIILTNHGYKCPNEEPIHFSKQFGNPIDVKKLIDDTDIKWNELDSLYLKHPSTQSLPFGMRKWREFFQELGVSDFVQVLHVERNVADVLCTDFKILSCHEDVSKLELIVKDWESPELVHFISTFTSNKCLEKCKYLLEVLDKMWDDCYSEKTKSYSLFQSKEDRKPFESSFIKSIRNFKWVACSIDNEVYDPKDLFYDCDLVRSILGDVAPYATPKVTSKRLLEDIGFKVQVSFADALRVIQLWRNSETPFASISQMSNFYNFIWDELATSKGNITDLRSSISVFIPLVHTSRNMDVVSGIFMSPDKVYWHDPTGCVDRMKETIHQYISTSKTGCSPCMTLAGLYPGLHDFFVNDCGVLEVPPFGRYLEILLQLSSNIKPSNVAHDVFQVFLKWADDLKSGSVNSEELCDLKENLVKSEYTVLPTMQDKWVSLHPHFGLICWADDEELMEQYKQFDGLSILQFGELTAIEKEMLYSKVASLMKNIGISALTEVVYREAIFYGRAESTAEAYLINWILPYAQRYIYKLHPDVYLHLKQYGFEKLTQLKVIAVEKLFFKNSLKGRHVTSKKRFECSCLLQGNILYTTKLADSHMMFFELSRFFFRGTPELHIANFLHMITVMAESGSTMEQIETFVLNSQKLPELPAGEPLWSLSVLLTPYGGEISQPLCSSTMEQSHLNLTANPFTKSNWPPTNWRTAPDFNLASDIHRGEIPRPAPAESSLEIPEPAPTKTEADSFKEHDLKLATLSAQSGIVDEEITRCSLEYRLAASVIAPDLDLGLTYASTLTESDRLCWETLNNDQSYKTGRLGEIIAHRYFTEKLGLKDVKWVNKESETGLPYDLIIGAAVNKEYVEVKATTSASRSWFPISANELQCAAEKGDSFTIARVILSSPTDAKIVVLKNPWKLCQQNLLQLVLLMPNSTGASTA